MSLNFLQTAILYYFTHSNDKKYQIEIYERTKKVNFDLDKISQIDRKLVRSFLINGSIELTLFLSAICLISSFTKILLNRKNRVLVSNRLFKFSMFNLAYTSHTGAYMGYYYFGRNKPVWEKEMEDSNNEEQDDQD